MRMRKTFVIFSLILLAVSLIGGVSAANTCLNSNDILLKLSSETNAHGSTLTSSYPEEICYSQFFTPSVSGASRGCSGLNKIVELSGSTNAHAQIPGGSGSYGTSICYEGLNCAAQTTDCVLPAKEIISISANTNAHLGIAGTYTKKICCSVGAAAPECSSYLDCPGQFCNTGTRTCMDCLRDADCSGGQYCDVGVTNTCVDCTQGDQCPSGDCNTATNTCAPTSSIAFWSNAEGVSVEDNDFFNATEKNPYMRVENGGAYKQVEFKIYESDGDGDDDRDILREDIFVTLDRDGNALIALNADIQFMSDAYSLEEELLVWDEEPEIVFEAIEKSLGGVVATSGAMEIISSRPAEGLSCASYNDSKDDCDDCDNFQNDHVQGSFENGEFDIMLEELEKVHEVEMECEKPIAVDPDVYGGCDRAKVECFCLYNETLTECLPRVGIDLLCGGNCGDGEVFEEVCDPSTQRSEWAISSCDDGLDYFDGGTLECVATGLTGECHFDTSGCTGGAGEGSCGDNDINIGESCEVGPINPNTDGVSCPRAYIFNEEDGMCHLDTENGCKALNFEGGGTLGCYSDDEDGDIKCSFDVSLCDDEDDDPSVDKQGGGCSFSTTSVGGDCSVDNFIEYSWIGIWDAGSFSEPALKVTCETGGSNRLVCPANIRLPFFGGFHIIVSLMILSLIYVAMNCRVKKE